MKNKLFILALFVFSATSLFSQRKLAQNQLLSDTKLVHFGFTLGLNEQNFGVTHSNFINELGTSYYMEVPTYSPGFTVGVISDLRLFEFLNLRFVPTLNFGDRKIIFVDENKIEAPKSQVVKSTLIDFPLYVKYRANRVNNYRPYLIAGAGLTLDLGRQKEDLLLLKPNDAMIEFGVGCDFYLPYFKFAPELKFCVGMFDVLEHDRPDLIIASDIKYTEAISKLTTRMFVLTFNFE